MHQAIWECSEDGGREGERSSGRLPKVNLKGGLGVQILPGKVIQNNQVLENG